MFTQNYAQRFQWDLFDSKYAQDCSIRWNSSLQLLWKKRSQKTNVDVCIKAFYPNDLMTGLAHNKWQPLDWIILWIVGRRTSGSRSAMVQPLPLGMGEHGTVTLQEQGVSSNGLPSETNGSGQCPKCLKIPIDSSVETMEESWNKKLLEAISMSACHPFQPWDGIWNLSLLGHPKTVVRPLFIFAETA